jgi:uncharacterized membrane protein YbhN (UPF0104 family)
MKPLITRLKLFLRWFILGGTLFFLAKVLVQNWQQVIAIRVETTGWAYLAIALGITLFAHIFAGWVWCLILASFDQVVHRVRLIQAYLQATIAKYLPGNIWHFYGRIVAAREEGIPLEVATVSVLLEPLLMAASALLLTLFSSREIVSQFGWPGVLAQWGGLLAVLAVIHPRLLNPVIQRLSKLKQKAATDAPPAMPFQLQAYPLIPFVGELGFLVLRSVGFLLTFSAVSSIAPSQVPLLVSAFSLAWLLGLVVPGAPGGIGVFEATAIALLGRTFPPGVVLTVVALYRLVSVLSEAMGAGLAWIDSKR